MIAGERTYLQPPGGIHAVGKTKQQSRFDGGLGTIHQGPQNPGDEQGRNTGNHSCHTHHSTPTITPPFSSIVMLSKTTNSSKVDDFSPSSHPGSDACSGVDRINTG